MKVALCFSGQPRSIQEAAPYWYKNLLDHYDTDIFVHTWFSDGNIPESVTSIINDLKIYEGRIRKLDCEIPLNSTWINQKYPNVVSSQFPAVNTVSMFYSIFRSNLSRKMYQLEKSIDYDVVIRARFDYALNNRFHLESIGKNPYLDEYIYVPDDVTNPNGSRDFCADTFAFGAPKVMDKYCQTFNNLDILYDNGIPMNGEDMLSANLNIYSLTGKHMQLLHMNNPFPPGKYNGNYHSIIRTDFKNFNTLRG